MGAKLTKNERPKLRHTCICTSGTQLAHSLLMMMSVYAALPFPPADWPSVASFTERLTADCRVFDSLNFPLNT